jgi:WD40 repeat protein
VTIPKHPSLRGEVVTAGTVTPEGDWVIVATQFDPLPPTTHPHLRSKNRLPGRLFAIATDNNYLKRWSVDKSGKMEYYRDNEIFEIGSLYPHLVSRLQIANDGKRLFVSCPQIEKQTVFERERYIPGKISVAELGMSIEQRTTANDRKVQVPADIYASESGVLISNVGSELIWNSYPSPDGKFFIQHEGCYSTLSIWNVTSKKPVFKVPDVSHSALHPNSKLLACLSREGPVSSRLQIIDLSSGNTVHDKILHQHDVDLHFSGVFPIFCRFHPDHPDELILHGSKEHHRKITISTGPILLYNYITGNCRVVRGDSTVLLGITDSFVIARQLDGYFSDNEDASLRLANLQKVWNQLEEAERRDPYKPDIDSARPMDVARKARMSNLSHILLANFRYIRVGTLISSHFAQANSKGKAIRELIR